MVKEYLEKKFTEHYEGQPRIFKAPGRVNLIGEHTDYNDGYVFPMAIDRYTYVVINQRNDQKLNIWSENLNESFSISLDNELVRRNHWSDYVIGVAWSLLRAGKTIRGADIYIESNVPVGSGLSSSAALEVSVAFALLSVNENIMDMTELAKLCQKAENEFVGMKCGIMDQFIACFGETDHALFLDCRSLDYELVPLPSDSIRIVVCNTMVKHELGASEYNKRRLECEKGVSILSERYHSVKALRDVALTQFMQVADSLPVIVRKRCHHVISENERVLESIKVLKRRDVKAFGKLMNASHKSLKEDYEVSCRTKL